MKLVTLIKDVEDATGTPYKRGMTVEVRLDRYRLPWVVGARNLKLSSNLYREPTLEEELAFLQTSQVGF
jgi:hypothetical protein